MLPSSWLEEMMLAGPKSNHGAWLDWALRALEQEVGMVKKVDMKPKVLSRKPSASVATPATAVNLPSGIPSKLKRQPTQTYRIELTVKVDNEAQQLAMRALMELTARELHRAAMALCGGSPQIVLYGDNFAVGKRELGIDNED